MSVIDYTYFLSGLTNIPNVAQSDVRTELNNYISNYEDLYFDDVLGVVLKDEFIAGIVPGSPEQKWIDLRDGKTFVYEDVTYKWRGFLNAIKKSPIANNVFWYFAKEKNTLFTGIGTTISAAENSERVSPIHLLVDNWNYMVEANIILEKFLLANEDDYPDYEPIDTLTKSINIYGI